MMFLNDRKPGRLAAALATTVVLLGAGACSGSDTEAAAPSKKTTTTVVAPAPFTEAAFTGSDEEFYLPPDPLPPGEPGELHLRGPQVMDGYWGRPEETAAALRA